MAISRRRPAMSSLLALVVVVGASCGPSSPPPVPGAAPPAAPAPELAATSTLQPPALGRVRYGDLRLLADAGVYIALDESYFAEQGIELELVTFDSGANMVAPLGANQIEVGGGAPTSGLYNALNRGIDLRIVADKGHSDPTPPGFAVTSIIIRKDLVDSGKIRSATDFNGLKYAMPGRGTSPQLDLAAFLREGSLTPKDLDINFMSFPDMVGAFANGSIDAAGPVEPFATTILNQGTGVLMKRDYEVNPNHQVAVLLYSPDFNRSDLAAKFMVAYLKGVRLYNDAFLKKDPTAREKAINAMVQHTPVKNRALYDQMVLPGLHPDGKMNLQSFDQQQDYFVASGEQQAQVELPKFIDLQHIEAAVRQLGAYQQ